MTAVGYHWATVRVLWWRDLVRFFRQPTRIVGALGQPVLFFFILGSGLGVTFTMPGMAIDYREYFFPGVVLMIVFFTSIFSTISIIEDRRSGFLQGVLAGPGGRGALVLGKCLGVSTIALLQGTLFLALLPFSGLVWSQVDPALLFGALALSAMGLAAFGFGLAWLIDNIQGYHAIQLTFLMPLWILSGAMFPPSPDAPLLQGLMRFNPASYAVAAVRHGFYGGEASAAFGVEATALEAMAILALLSLASLFFAARVSRRNR